eukprot:TRINITY_DN421_c0_g1_i1.p1 TRINITY_DN421_c0_g1~~TRINITY_DN421_c0_g1_i1.p1  ORF type:complete len:528 (+),score=241.06 TRINITY_DN421_c0_g1_i1:564-2147(+)
MENVRSRQELRKKDFKTVIDADDTRKKRIETAVAIRKVKKDENLQKRRNLTEFDTTVDPFSDLPASSGSDFFGSSSAVPAGKIENLPNMVAAVMSNDPQAQLEATIQFRKLLSIERNPPIEEVIATRVVPKFVQFLTFAQHPNLQFEAAWALTNVASGTSDQTRYVLEAGAVPVLVNLLTSPNDDVREQAIWALGNIAGDSPQCRDIVLQNHALGPLLANMNENSKLSLIRNATWTLSNFCRGKPAPPFDFVKPALPILARLVFFQDEEVLTDACWALSYISDGPNERIQAVLEVGLGRRMVELLMHSSFSVQTPALRTVGNIVTGDDLQTQSILNVGVTACLLSLLGSPKRGIKKEACWTVSNITAGNAEQIQHIVNADIFSPLIKLLATAEFDIKKEAAWAISNATSGGTPEQIKYLVDCGCIKPLCDLLYCTDPRIILVALEAIENILKSSEELQGDYITKIEEAEGLDKLEQLQNHHNHDIYNKVQTLIKLYFENDDELPMDGDHPGFSFGGAAPQGSGGFNF